MTKARQVKCPTCNFIVFLYQNNTIVPHYGKDWEYCEANNTLYIETDEVFEDGTPVSIYEQYIGESHDTTI